MLLPKFITKSNGKYRVDIREDLADKKHYVATFDNISEAVIDRDNYMEKNSINKSLVKYPKGITRVGNKYQAQISLTNSVKTHTHFIGYYDTVELAVQARLDFIESLK